MNIITFLFMLFLSFSIGNPAFGMKSFLKGIFSCCNNAQSSSESDDSESSEEKPEENTDSIQENNKSTVSIKTEENKEEPQQLYNLEQKVMLMKGDALLIEECLKSNPSLETIKFLLENKINPNSDVQYKDDSTPLLEQVCKYSPSFEVIKLLVEYGARKMDKPLKFICDRDNPSLEIIRLLIENGANPNCDGNPLHLLCSRNNPSVNAVKLLLAKDGNPHIRDYRNRTLLHSFCCRNDPSLELIDLFLSKNVNPNIRDNYGNTPLHWTCTCSNASLAVIKLLTTYTLRNATNFETFKLLQESILQFIRTKNNDDETAWMIAKRKGHIKIADFLERLEKALDQEYDAFINHMELLEEDYKQYDIQNNHELLNEHNKNNQSTDIAGLRPIINKENNQKQEYNPSKELLKECFDRKVKFEIINLLLENNANPNIQDEYGTTPLLAICEKNPNSRIIDLLLKYGANPNLQDKNGKTPLYALFTWQYPDKTIIELLLKNNAHPNLPKNNGDTPLKQICGHCKKREIDIIKLLLEYGADHQQIQKEHGWTLLHEVCSNPEKLSPLAVKFLIDPYFKSLKKSALTYMMSLKRMPKHVRPPKFINLGILKSLLDPLYQFITAKNKDGKTALIIAEKKGNTKIAAFLKSLEEALNQGYIAFIEFMETFEKNCESK